MVVDTAATSYQPVNKIPGAGGSIDAAGLFAGDGMVFVNSGYASFGPLYQKITREQPDLFD